MRQHPGRFKALLGQAKQLEVTRASCLGALCELHKQLRAMGPTPAAPCNRETDVPYVEACIPCKLGFADRRSWAGHLPGNTDTDASQDCLRNTARA